MKKSAAEIHAGVSIDQFRNDYSYLVQWEPPPLMLLGDKPAAAARPEKGDGKRKESQA